MCNSSTSVMTLLDLLRHFLKIHEGNFEKFFFSLGYVYPYKFAMKNNKVLSSNFKYIEIILCNSSDSDY